MKQACSLNINADEYLTCEFRARQSQAEGYL
jgi:hypothetical protein